MLILSVVAVLLAAYLIGSIPFGWVVVKISTGKDVRQVASGRTGGTNVMRAAGAVAGLLTGFLDLIKGTLTVYLVRWFIPADVPWFHLLEVAAPLLAIVGHNYSIYLIERQESTGKISLRGGAGGAPCLGGVFGLWWPAGVIALAVMGIMFFGVGYASVATMSVAFVAAVIFAIEGYLGNLPWEYVLYGVVSEILLLWALRPNLERLRKGNERMHGIRVWFQKRQAKKASDQMR
jgi:acyl phosphate:glycerol-3-phosphate acyltransferase